MPTPSPTITDPSRKAKMLSHNCLEVIGDRKSGSRAQWITTEQEAPGLPHPHLGITWRNAAILVHQGTLCRQRPQPPDPSSYMRVLDNGSVFHSTLSWA